MWRKRELRPSRRGDVQMRQIEALVADLCHGLRKHFERHTVAVLAANAFASTGRAAPPETRRSGGIE